MSIKLYFPTTNPVTSPSDPNALTAEGYYWLGWRVADTSYASYSYRPTELAINIPEFKDAFYLAASVARVGRTRLRCAA